MLIFGSIFFAIMVLLVIYFIAVYNGLVTLKHNTSKSWSNIDVLLKQRHDELPKLIAVCRQYMQYEQQTLAVVIEARAGVSRAREDIDINAMSAAEAKLRRGTAGLFAVAEAYPELKANRSFQQLQNRISGLEDAIAKHREFYNENVNNNNIRIEQFPDIFVARLFNFKPFDLLEFSSEEKRDIDVKALF